MASNDLNLTFETLFDITRREKMQEDLQKLDSEFFNNLITYINEKSKILEKETQSNLFARDEKQITRKQLENIRRLTQELYARRERKIVNLAIIKSRTNSKLIDTSALLTQEKSLFLFILKLLNHSKKNILYNLLQGQMPNNLDVAVCFNIGNDLNNVKTEGHVTRIQDDYLEIKSEQEEKPQLEKQESNENKQETIISKTVKFLSPVPKFVGKELEVYGPYEKEDVASLPGEIAEVLISKGRAQEIKQE
jgi:DNA replication initiation complex subunit (GINS family)